MIIRIYGKTFYPTKKVADSVFEQGGTADGYYKWEKSGVIRFFLLNGESVIIDNKKLIKAVKTGDYLHILLQGFNRFEIRTLKYTQDGYFVTLWDVITIYLTKAKAFKAFQALLVNSDEGLNAC